MRVWDKFNECFWYSDRFSKKVNYYLMLEEMSKSGNELSEEQLFAGLHDKEGKPIYEGDIVNFDRKSTVIFEDGAFSLKPFNSKYYYRLTQEQASVIEIIGNLRENPELLK